MAYKERTSLVQSFVKCLKVGDTIMDPFSNFRKYMIWTFILIIFLIVSGIAVAGEKSEWLNDNPCMIKVVTTEKCLDSQCLIKRNYKRRSYGM